MGMITKAFITIVLVGLIVMGFWIMSWKNIQKTIINNKNKIASKKEEYSNLVQESKNLAKWRTDVAAWNDVLQKLHQTKTIKNFIPSFLVSIEKLAKYERNITGDSTFQITAITPGQFMVTGSTAPRTAKNNKAPAPGLVSGKSSVSITFTGKFNTVVNFLEQLGNFKLNKLVTIQRISLSPSGAKPGIHPTLTVTMPFEMYMLGG